MTKTVFVYWGPHHAHKAWAESVGSKFYSFVPFNSNIIKSHGILLHFFSFLKALLFLPFADVYLLESPMMIPAVLTRTLFSKKKVIAINSDPFLWTLPKYNVLIRKPFELLIKRIDCYISTSEMMDILAKKTGKKHAIADLYVDRKFFAVNANLKSNNGCFIGPYLNTQKGVDILAELFSELPDSDERKLYLIGSVRDTETQKSVDKHENIEIIYHTPNPADYLKKCGLYFNLSRFEPAGINILEAMAAGIPPIVTPMCGFSSIVKQLSPKLVINPNKKEFLNIVHWLENTADKKSLGKKARSIAKKYTKQHSIDDFRKKFSSLL